MYFPEIEQALKHFGRVAQNYRQIRITDPEPVEVITTWVKKIGLKLVDAGCGTGRYTELLIRKLKPKVCYCLDATAEMLEKAKECLTPLARQTELNFLESLARAMPIANSSLDLVTTFNAIHHFVVPQFLKEAARILKPGGFLCIYTRTPQQNRRTIWGRYFPFFCQKERRLLSESKLTRFILSAPQLKLRSITKFIFKRSTSLEQLKSSALHRNYSTFSLYSKSEFQACLDQFVRKLLARYPDPQNIDYTAENILYVVQKNG